MPPSPQPRPWPIPKFLIRIDDLDHEGADIFLAAVSPKDALRAAVLASFTWLYTQSTAPRYLKQIILILRSMDGVAYTTGTQVRKEIHFSLDYIKGAANRAREEIMGVLVHEVVHCYQYTAFNTPGGLIEGMADFVRLRENLSPPHWKRVAGETWDAGYEKTAYFLDWIEDRYGDGCMRELNASMLYKQFDPSVFKEITGRSLPKLWNIYCASLEEPAKKEGYILVSKEETLKEEDAKGLIFELI